jgi:hypothetical protein
MGWSRGGAVAHSQTAHTSAPFVDSLRPLFPYLHCVRKVATIPLGWCTPHPDNRLALIASAAVAPGAAIPSFHPRIRRGASSLPHNDRSWQHNQKDTQMRGLARGHGRDPELSSSSY